ncbi:MAG: SHOCT domain-containing protein [Saprospiraceae bacterium]|nr:SHOCT domain-containing protein [Saprospiraceae bacterium]MCB9321655.1 SHOCT domain-containing protein [Lewinellaceae bacterium]
MARRDKNTAAFISLVLGWIGLHQLYLRKPAMAFLFIGLLVFFKLPVAVVFGFINAVLLLMMSDEEFDRRYNNNETAQQGPTWDRRRDYQRRTQRNGDYRRADGPYRRNFSQPDPVMQRKSNPFKTTGVKKYKDFDVDGAIEDFKQALEIDPNDIATHFNIACAYSLNEEKEKAYYHLSKAVQLGFKDLQKIKTHDDLAFVRIQPEFDAFEESGFTVNPFTEQKQEKESAQAEQTKQTEQTENLLDDDLLLSQLNKLKELREKGLITEEEFALETRKLRQ